MTRSDPANFFGKDESRPSELLGGCFRVRIVNGVTVELPEADAVDIRAAASAGFLPRAGVAPNISALVAAVGPSLPTVLLRLSGSIRAFVPFIDCEVGIDPFGPSVRGGRVRGTLG